MKRLTELRQIYALRPGDFVVLPTGETCRVIGYRDGFFHLCEYIPERDGVHMTKTNTIFKSAPYTIIGGELLEV